MSQPSCHYAANFENCHRLHKQAVARTRHLPPSARFRPACHMWPQHQPPAQGRRTPQRLVATSKVNPAWFRVTTQHRKGSAAEVVQDLPYRSTSSAACTALASIRRVSPISRPWSGPRSGLRSRRARTAAVPPQLGRGITPDASCGSLVASGAPSGYVVFSTTCLALLIITSTSDGSGSYATSTTSTSASRCTPTTRSSSG